MPIHPHTGGSDDNLADGLLWGIAPAHLPGLVAVAALPLVLWAFLRWRRASAEGGSERARRFVAGVAAAPLPTCAGVLLMLVSATIHLVLAPAAGAATLGGGALFVGAALTLATAGYRAFTGRRWRGLALTVLTGSVVAYIGSMLAGEEGHDEVGLATKMVELTAIALLLIPPRRGVRRRFLRVRRLVATTSVVPLTTLTGATVWADAFADADEATRAAKASGEPIVGHGTVGMAMQPDTDEPPTAAQLAAADRLVAATRTAIAQYADPAAAVAAGYRPSGPTTIGAVVHYEHQGRLHDGVTLDPSQPEMLVYGVTVQGPLLLGVVYALPWPLAEAPDAGGGSLTAWHAHTNVCFSLAGLVGLLSPFGTCPAGSANIAFGPMLHVWTVDLPGSPFGLEPNEQDLKQLRIPQ